MFLNHMDDAVSIAPDAHEVVFEDDAVRALQVTMPIGGRTSLHWHPRNINYVQVGGTLRFTKTDGSHTDVTLTVGQVMSSPGGEHAVENIGDSEVQTIQIELKAKVYGIMPGMEIDKHAVSTRLLWVDLEMTGLDPDEHVITEIAAAVTDWDFKTLAAYEAVIFHPDDVLDKANDFSKQMDAQNGMFAQIREHGRPEQDVVRELAEFIRTNFGSEPAVLAGNSIHNDRRFIKKWWPEVDALLHYRMLDVSSWKLVMQGKYGVSFEKQETHRAAADIRESIAELEFYLAWFHDSRN